MSLSSRTMLPKALEVLWVMVTPLEDQLSPPGTHFAGMSAAQPGRRSPSIALFWIPRTAVFTACDLLSRDQRVEQRILGFGEENRRHSCLSAQTPSLRLCLSEPWPGSQGGGLEKALPSYPLPACLLGQITHLSFHLGCPAATPWLAPTPALPGPSPGTRRGRETKRESHPGGAHHASSGSGHPSWLPVHTDAKIHEHMWTQTHTGMAHSCPPPPDPPEKHWVASWAE